MAHVVVIKISRLRKEICLSVWKATLQERDTRAEYPRRATEVQRVHITLAQERLVANTTIFLSFEGLFERVPRQRRTQSSLYKN